MAGRVGYEPQVHPSLPRCVGAAYVAAFPATAFGDITNPQPCNSAVYMGDASYTVNQTLTNATILALERVRALGAEVLFGPMVLTPLAITATVYLWDQPRHPRSAAASRTSRARDAPVVLLRLGDGAASRSRAATRSPHR